MSGLSHRMKVEIWSDPICPWCWIGKKRYDSALAEFAHRDRVITLHHGYRIGKNMPTMPFIHHLYQAIDNKQNAHDMLDRIGEAAASVGLNYHIAGMRYGDTADAHTLLAAAENVGLGDAMQERFFRANMIEGRSLFDQAELRALAVEAGMDDQVVTTVLACSKFRKALEADEHQAMSWGERRRPAVCLRRAR